MKRDQNNIKEKRFSNMTAEQKLDLSIHLYYSAKELKKAALKQFHPDWDSIKIEKETREIFLNART
jgi:hypothetical protein